MFFTEYNFSAREPIKIPSKKLILLAENIHITDCHHLVEILLFEPN